MEDQDIHERQRRWIYESSIHCMYEKMSISMEYTAGQSPWSNGLVERQNHVIAEMLGKVLEGGKCDFDLALAWKFARWPTHWALVWNTHGAGYHFLGTTGLLSLSELVLRFKLKVQGAERSFEDQGAVEVRSKVKWRERRRECQFL